jgi:hypothetical protein
MVFWGTVMTIGSLGCDVTVFLGVIYLTPRNQNQDSN